jgi:PDZ domain
MRGVRLWSIGDRLNRVVVAWCVAALALGYLTPASAYYKAPAPTPNRSATQNSGSFSVLSARNSPASTLEVPSSAAVGSIEDESAQPEAPPSNGTSPCVNCDPDPDTPVGEAEIPNGAANYDAGSSDFDMDDVATSWIGLSLSRDHRRLKSGEYASGLIVVAVEPGSPGAAAGLQPRIEGKARKAVEMATLAAGMAFTPAMIGVAIVNSIQLDESYDMIIGIDGDRIMNVVDFEDHLCAVRAGEIVYLNLVRNGVRLQIPVPIPSDMATPYCSSVSRLIAR